MFEPRDKEPLIPLLRVELRSGLRLPAGALPRAPVHFGVEAERVRHSTTSPSAGEHSPRACWNPKHRRADDDGLETVLERRQSVRIGKFEARNGESRLGSYPGRPALRLLLESIRGPLGGPLRVRAPILRRAGGDHESSSERGG